MLNKSDIAHIIFDMGFFDGLRLAARTNRAALAPVGASGDVQLAPPWQADDSASLARLVTSDLYPSDKERPITRGAAMRVPAVVKGRALIVEKVAAAPLRVLRHENGIDSELEAPAWLHATGVQAVSPWQRMADTVDDLIFLRHALWLLARDEADNIIAATHVPSTLWRVDATSRVIQLRSSEDAEKWRDARLGEVVIFTGPQDGLLTIAEDTIRAALDIERTWRARARSPLPMIILRERDNADELTNDERKELVAAASAARLDEHGAVMLVPPGIDVEVVGSVQTDLLTGGRNAVKLDVAAFLNLPGAALDATLDKSSLTYTTTEGAASELTDRLAYWTAAIEQRLSLDDITPTGTRVRFHMATPPPTGPITED